MRAWNDGLTDQQKEAAKRKQFLERYWQTFKQGQFDYKPECIHGQPCDMMQAIQGRTFFHQKTGKLYQTAGYFWDSGRDRYMLRYQEFDLPRKGKDGLNERREVYAHLLEDFLQTGRFMEVTQ